MEFRKMLMITLYAEQKKKDTDLQNSLLDSVGEGEICLWVCFVDVFIHAVF